MPARFLPPERIPHSLWISPGSLLHLPLELAAVYTAEIDSLGLRDQALSARSQDGPTGGVTLQQTHDHFAERFAASCARLELAMLDPKDELQEASDLVLKIFAGGKIALLDVPCGAGAASVTLLSTIACLRKEKRLPSLPLDVMLVGGDLSQPARELAERLIVALQPTLEAQSIFVQSQWAEWNALDADETTGLLNDWITGSVDFDRHFLVLANFSSFLHREKQFTKANPQLREMIRWTSLRASSMVLWVEPPTNEAANFFQQLGGALLTKLRRIGLWRKTEPGRPHASTLCNMQHPLEPARTYRTGVHIIVLKQTASI